LHCPSLSLSLTFAVMDVRQTYIQREYVCQTDIYTYRERDSESLREREIEREAGREKGGKEVSNGEVLTGSCNIIFLNVRADTVGSDTPYLMSWRTYFGHIGPIGWAFRMVCSKYWGTVLE
jgi:hypothetical protein